MRNSHYLIALLLLSFSWSCEKQEDNVIRNDLYIKEEIKGIVSLNDAFTDEPSVLAPQATIYVSENIKADTYLFSTKSDKEGNFSFTHRPKQATFCLIGQYKDKNGILFESSVSYTTFLATNTIVLTPEYPKGKIKLIVKDEAGHPVFGSAIYLFINESQAKSISEATPNGYIQSFTTNARGTAFFYNLEQGTYFVTAKKGNLITGPTNLSVGSDNVSSFSNTITTSGTSVTSIASLTLALPTQPAQLTVNVKDGDLSPVSGAYVYVFSSSKQAESIRRIPPLGFIGDSVRTDQKGQAKISGLITGTTYYIDARASFVGSGTAVAVKTSSPGALTATVANPVTLTLTK